jgi:3-hydroxyacyl-CoA dehydrogenase
MQMKTVTVIGANGTIGSKIGGMIAAFTDAEVYMMARTMEDAEKGVRKAIASVRSSTLESRLLPCTLSEAKDILSKSDWIFESVVEDMEVKKSVNRLINQHASSRCIITTGTSGISIHGLAEAFSSERQKNFFATHFFNPPLKMTACELIPTHRTDAELLATFTEFLESTLHRTIIPIESDRAAFAGNYIGFRLFEMATFICEQYADKGGIDYVDYILGNVAGNTMAPLTTLDYVGLDVYQSIVENIHDRIPGAPARKISGFIRQLIHDGHTGIKARRGLYEYAHKAAASHRVWDVRDNTYRDATVYGIPIVETIRHIVRHGRYSDVLPCLLGEKSDEAFIVLSYILSYIVFSFDLVPEVVNDIHHVDAVMMNGFAWTPPTFWLWQLAQHQNSNAIANLCEKYDVDISAKTHSQIERYLNRGDRNGDAGYRNFTVSGNLQ